MATSKIHGRISTFKAVSNLDYARPNLFQVDIDFPTPVVDLIVGTGAKDAGEFSPVGPATSDPAPTMRQLGAFQIKAAQIPASTVGVVEVPFRGRMLKIAGDRTFEPWTITVHNDTAYRLRSWFEKWMEAIQVYDENATLIEYGSPVGGDYLKYMKDMRVTQLDRRGNAVRSYRFYDCWPSNVSSIDLDYGSNDAIEEFTVELQVQYWKPEAGKTDADTDKIAP